MRTLIVLLLGLAIALPMAGHAEDGAAPSGGGASSGDGGNRTANATASPDATGGGDHGHGNASDGGPSNATESHGDGGNETAGNDTGRGAHAARGDEEQADHADRDWGNLSEDQRAEGLARAEDAGLFAGFHVANGSAEGRFVRFQYDLAGDVRNLTAVELNATFLALVEPRPFAANGTSVHGAEFRERGDNASLSVHNNPTAQLAVRGENLTVAVALAPGVGVTNVTGRLAELRAGNATAALLLLGNASWNRTAGGFAVRVADGGIMFLARPGGDEGADLRDVAGGLASGRVGAMARIAGANGTAIADADSNGVTVSDAHASNRSLRLTLGSDTPEPRAVVLRVDHGTLPAGRPEDITVRLDGVALNRSASALDAIQATDRGEGAAFVNVTAAGIEIVVSVPHFSDHLLTLDSSASSGSTGTGSSGGAAGGNATGSPAPAPSLTNATPGPGLLLALGAVALAAAAARRKR